MNSFFLCVWISNYVLTATFETTTRIWNVAEFILGDFFCHFLWLFYSHHEVYELPAYGISYIALDDHFYSSLRKHHDQQAVVEHTVGAIVV